MATKPEEELRITLVKVMGFAGFAEAERGRFGCEVALRSGEQFVADHELANNRRAQERREIVGVQVPGFVNLAVGRLLMEAHGIRECCFEQIVITNGDAAEDIAEEIAFV